MNINHGLYCLDHHRFLRHNYYILLWLYESMSQNTTPSKATLTYSLSLTQAISYSAIHKLYICYTVTSIEGLQQPVVQL